MFTLTNLALLLAFASLVMHFIAPLTKNTVDDKIAAAIDALRASLESLPKDPPQPVVSKNHPAT